MILLKDQKPSQKRENLFGKEFELGILKKRFDNYGL
jgi:hypothetical protein